MKIPALFRYVAVTTISTLFCAAQSPPPGMPASTAARILEQATWGPTDASVLELQTKGFDQWYADQMSAPITSYSNQPMLAPDGNAFTNISGIQTQFFRNALNNPDQLRQRVAFALSEIWVVSHVSIPRAASFPPLLNIFQKDAFVPYTTLMKDVSLNSAMGAYLDMLNNKKATKTTSPNENYARELMQLFTLGVNNVRLDGSPVLDSNGALVPTYSEATVKALTAALTGWVYAPTAAGATPPNVFVPMVPNEPQHDTSLKTLPFVYPDGRAVNIALAANQSAEPDLDAALAAIFKHPSLAPFVVKQLIQHLVTSSPSPDYIQRVVTVFNDNAGDLKPVLKAILVDPEARAGDRGISSEPANFGHLREPVLLVANLLRGLNATVMDSSTVYTASTNLGQNLLNPPSVFSYFSPQYRIRGGALAPEFQIHSTQTAVNRENMIYNAIYNSRLDTSTLFNLNEFVTAAASPATLKALIGNRFFHGQMSAGLQSAIDYALVGLTTPTRKAQDALYVALTSSEYQIIH